MDEGFYCGCSWGVQNGYSLCGVVDRKARVYPLGSDTKVISSLFEIVARQAVVAYAESKGLRFIEPTKQNHYLDFTLMRDEKDKEKIALDVKTTYRRGRRLRFRYTLGSYTSYIHPETEEKNIVFLTTNIKNTGLLDSSITGLRSKEIKADVSTPLIN